jgi:Tol biopolymer transport system component
MAENRHFLPLVAAVGVLVALGLLVLTVMVVQERSADATSPGQPGKIAYSAYDGTNEAIYTIDPGGGSKVKVTDKPGYARNPAYSSTGNKIAYSGHDGNDSEIYTINPAGGEPLKVTDNDTDDFSPSYSPDGNNIAYVGNDGNDLEIYTINVRGGSTLKVTDNDTDDLYPSYSPDGQTIAYVGYPQAARSTTERTKRFTR